MQMKEQGVVKHNPGESPVLLKGVWSAERSSEWKQGISNWLLLNYATNMLKMLQYKKVESFSAIRSNVIEIGKVDKNEDY